MSMQADTQAPALKPIARAAFSPWLQPRIAVPGGLLGLFVLGLWLGPAFWAAAPNAANFDAVLQPPLFFGGSLAHPLGTDQLGRDILARLLEGGRSSLAIAALAVIGSAAIGVAAGLTSGYLGGLFDMAVMRLADVQLAFPSFLLALTILAALPPGVGPLMAVMVLSGWVLFARVVRGQVLRLRESTFVEAARGLGASRLRIILRHLLPNTIGTIVVLSTILLSQLVILQAGLSFLGLGVPPPAPSWGSSLSEGVGFLTDAWWLATFPGVALMIVVLLINLLGDALRDVLNPALRIGRK